jgi:hypothetical protein
MTHLSDFDCCGVTTVARNLAAKSNRFGNRPGKVLSKRRGDRRHGAAVNLAVANSFAANSLATMSLLL